jgi:hypothetical protein
MPETLNESQKRFNKELDRIKEVVPVLHLSSMLPCCGQYSVLQGSLDRFATFAVERPEDVAVLADRVLGAIDRSIEELVIARRLVKKYIRERKDDGNDSVENTIHSEA